MAAGFGETLRELRDAAGLTQGQLAERIGVAQTVISRWENGGRVPTWEFVQRIADALGVSTDALRTIEPGEAILDTEQPTA